MYEKHEVGSRIYVWTIGKKTNAEAVISAHGGQSIINSTFPVPRGVKFYFYGPHGYLLADPGLVRIIYGEVKPLEKLDSGQCHDYGLSKYQGEKHGSNQESYDAIEMLGITTEELLAKGFKEDQLRTMKRPRNDLDIITIRNRRAMPSPSLKEVMSEVLAAGYKYTVIHCSFCRGPSLKKDLGTHDAQKNPDPAF